MPGLDGIGVARALAAHDPSPAVVFVTAFDQFAVAAFEVEAVDYLMKPVDPSRLAASARSGPGLSRQPRGPRARREGSRWLEEFWASDLSGLVRIAAKRRGPRVRRARLYAAARRPPKLAHPPFDGRARRRARSRSCSCGSTARRSSARTSSPDSRATLRDDGSRGSGNSTEQPVGRLYSDRVRAIAGR